MNQMDMASEKKKNDCPHCGNNQTSHVNAWIDSTVCAFMNPVSQKFLETYIGRALFGFTNYILKGALWLFVLIKVIRFDSDHACIVSDRGRVIAEEAQARGLKMETARVFGKVTDAYRITFPNGKKFFFSGLPRAGSNADVLSGWIDDKALLKACLSREGVPVSKGASFTDFLHAEHFFHTLRKPVIVKPRLGSRGRHTNTHLANAHDFKRAFFIAKQLGRSVIVEEHLVGSVYRATIIDGVLGGVLAGDPPRITGDGVHTIQELIEIKNINRDARMGEVKVTDGLIHFLEKQKYTLDLILPQGIVIDLSEKIGLSYGGNSREVTPEVHPKLHAELERAARIVGDPLLGFDFITTDVSADPDTVRWGIIECNSVPFIDLHHHPLVGEPINIAAMVLNYLERKIHIKKKARPGEGPAM
jgi:D-alanine-D-alanine ligase-like ATP-grasp enzyme